MFELRPYQQAAVDAAKESLKQSLDSIVIEAATGAGKSLIVAEIAKWLNEISNNKRVLCLAPSKELLEQNSEKYRAYGKPCSIYSASISKSMTHPVVFGSPLTVKSSIKKFANCCAVVIDECHGITPTIKSIIRGIRELNPKLRVVGLTATPYRLGEGYIYEINDKNITVNDDAYFKKLVYRITAKELIDLGYLTQPHSEVDLSDAYHTMGLKRKSNGQLTDEQIRQTFEEDNTKTSLITREIVNITNAQNRMGVMIFAASITHAEYICKFLPRDQWRLVTGETPKKERENIVKSFKERQFKYVVNVSVLTTGFDAPHVDVVAILRATESASLLQQIIGRGLRIHPDKKDCLILDYAENIERHCPSGDIFEPEIKESKKEGESVINEFVCPSCLGINEFKLRENPDCFDIDANGYLVDLAGNRVTIEANGVEKEMPAHYGRICQHNFLFKSEYIRCGYRWSYKECPECEHKNDIAARKCEKCKAELVDPNEKLKIEFKKIKRDPYALSTDRVLSWRPQVWNSQKGNETLRVDYTTDCRTFSVWYMPKSNITKKMHAWQDLCNAVFGRVAPDAEKFMAAISKGYGAMPQTVTVKKTGDFFEIYGHNKPEDKPE